MRHAPTLLALCLCLALAPALAAAQDSMSAAEFEAYVEGKSFIYMRDGQAYGGEDHLDDRQVRWSFLDGRCMDGRWYEEDGNICFVYDDVPGPQCWQFTMTAQGMSARFMSPEPNGSDYLARLADEPLLCLGPEVGA